MTYLATSLKLAKFSVTERTAGRAIYHDGYTASELPVGIELLRTADTSSPILANYLHFSLIGLLLKINIVYSLKLKFRY